MKKLFVILIVLFIAGTSYAAGIANQSNAGGSLKAEALKTKQAQIAAFRAMQKTQKTQFEAIKKAQQAKSSAMKKDSQTYSAAYRKIQTDNQKVMQTNQKECKDALNKIR